MTAVDGSLSASQRRSLRTALLRWYDREGRSLPWRSSGDPYRVWVSEIMLQQTTVAAVLPYFARFVRRFPTVESLAEASADEVLRLWEGLGYYSRARHLHSAARRIVEHHAGEFPQSVAALQQLPGIGRYTAGAIASFAFGQPAPIVEANTARLYARLIGLTESVRSAGGQRRLWNVAESIVGGRRPGDVNQAAMDLGATLCTPARPDCGRCPLTRWCTACQTGRQDDFPVADARTAITDVSELLLAVRRRGRWLVRQRQPGERWAGLWDFPRLPLNDADAGLLAPRRSAEKAGRPRYDPRQRPLFRQTLVLPPTVAQAVRDDTGLTIRDVERITEIRHAVTRFRIQLICCLADRVTGRVSRVRGFVWKSMAELTVLPLSVTGRQVCELLKSR